MKHVENDLVYIIRRLAEFFVPLAEASKIHIFFHTPVNKLKLQFNHEALISDLSHLFSRMIIHTQPGDHFTVGIVQNEGLETWQIYLENTVTSMCALKDLIKDISHTSQVEYRPDSGVRVTLDLDKSQHLDGHSHLGGTYSEIPEFHKKFRHYLLSHATNVKDIETTAYQKGPQAIRFLNQVSSVIKEHIDDEQFDTNELCHLLCMSRVQLYRKLKPIINQSPGSFIRFIRFQKAKNLLRTTSIPIGDIGSSIGFSDHSHFTRAFKRQFQMSPSRYRKLSRPSQQTNQPILN